MLVEAADHQLGGIVGAWDEGALYPIDQLGPMVFQRVKDAGGLGGWGDIVLPQSDDPAIPFLCYAPGPGLEDGVDLLLEFDCLGMRLGVVCAVHLFQLAMQLLKIRYMLRFVSRRQRWFPPLERQKTSPSCRDARLAGCDGRMRLPWASSPLSLGLCGRVRSCGSPAPATSCEALFLPVDHGHDTICPCFWQGDAGVHSGQWVVGP
jgi:hypothetical protein